MHCSFRSFLRKCIVEQFLSLGANFQCADSGRAVATQDRGSFFSDSSPPCVTVLFCNFSCSLSQMFPVPTWDAEETYMESVGSASQPEFCRRVQSAVPMSVGPKGKVCFVHWAQAAKEENASPLNTGRGGLTSSAMMGSW